MALTASAEAYVSKPSPALAFVLTIAASSATRQLAEVDLGSIARGNFSGRITSVSNVRIGFGDWRAGLEALEIRIEVEDLDRDFSSLLLGSAGAGLYGAPVALELASTSTILAPGAAPGLGDWPLVFSGMFDHAEQGRSGSQTLVLRTDDRELQRPLNLPTLTPALVPFAVGPVLGGGAPLAYGVLDSRALVGTVDGTTGAIPCLYLGDYNATAWRYLVSFGQMFHIERLFKDGVFVSPASWTKEVVDLGPGLYATCVRFASSQGTSRITVDGVGMHPDMSIVSQAPYTTPVAILRHLLNNFVFRAWRGGDRPGGWFGDSSRIDVPSWDAAHAYALRQDLRASLYLGPDEIKTRAIDILSEFARDKGFRLFWTESNKLAIAIRDQAPAAVYATGSRWIDAGQLSDPAAIAILRPSRDDVDGIRREFWRMPADAGGTTARARATIIRPGGSGLSIEDHSSRLGPASRYCDRNMLAPASIKIASAAFNLGVFAGGSGLKDQALVSTWNGHFNGFNTRYDWTAAGAARPTLKLGRVNARPAISFDGTANRMDLSTTSGSVITTTAFQIWIVFRVRSVNTDSTNPYDNDALITDTLARFGIFFRNTVGAYTLNAWTYDGAYKLPTPKSIALNTWYLVRWRLFAGVGFLSLSTTFGPSETFVTTGALVDVAGTPRLGANYNASQFFDGEIAEVDIFSAGDLSGSGPWSFASPGASLEWEHFDNLSREYGLV